MAAKDRRIKLIDLGASADLVVGINYVPNEYLLDPRFAPPQQYVMSAQTARCGACDCFACALKPGWLAPMVVSYGWELVTMSRTHI